MKNNLNVRIKSLIGGNYFQDAAEIVRVINEAPCSDGLKQLFLTELKIYGHPDKGMCSGHMIDCVDTGFILGGLLNNPIVDLDDFFKLKDHVADLCNLPIHHQVGEGNLGRYTIVNGQKIFVINTEAGDIIFPEVTKINVKEKRKQDAEQN